MAFTPAQYRAFVYQTLLEAFDLAEWRELRLLARRIRHYRLNGTVDEQDAALQIAREIAERVVGHSPLTDDEVHLLRLHSPWAVDDTDMGEI